MDDQTIFESNPWLYVVVFGAALVFLVFVRIVYAARRRRRTAQRQSLQQPAPFQAQPQPQSPSQSHPHVVSDWSNTNSTPAHQRTQSQPPSRWVHPSHIAFDPARPPQAAFPNQHYIYNVPGIYPGHPVPAPASGNDLVRHASRDGQRLQLHQHQQQHYQSVATQTEQRQPHHSQDNQRFNPDELISFDATGDDKTNPCPICLGLLEEEPVSTGQCLHLMHTSCLKSWLAKDTKAACPVCRVPYADSALPSGVNPDITNPAAGHRVMNTPVLGP